jgi:hypothetical protein
MAGHSKFHDNLVIKSGNVNILGVFVSRDGKDFDGFGAEMDAKVTNTGDFI